MSAYLYECRCIECVCVSVCACVRVCVNFMDQYVQITTDFYLCAIITIACLANLTALTCGIATPFNKVNRMLI